MSEFAVDHSRAPAERVALALQSFMALAAVAGGALLVARPDGSLLGMSTALLERSPFSDFLVPGLLLTLVVGGMAWLSDVALVRRGAGERPVVVAAQATLLVWLAVEGTMIGFHALQPLCGAVAVGLLVLVPRLPRG